MDSGVRRNDERRLVQTFLSAHLHPNLLQQALGAAKTDVDPGRTGVTGNLGKPLGKFRARCAVGNGNQFRTALSRQIIQFLHTGYSPGPRWPKRRTAAL